MQNRVTRLDDDRTPRASRWAADENPRGRLWGLFALFSFVLLAVIARTAQLQIGLSDDYQREFERIAESFESIPSRDARIISSDGQVLARDVSYFQVAVHYRWLESPPDPGWLKMKARARLTRRQRRDPQLMDAATRQVLDQRAQMWRNLSKLSGIDSSELARRREKIQRGVEHIVASTEKRRAERLNLNSQSAETETDDGGGTSWWQRGWATVVKTLTTTPDRGRLDPIVVQEQEDYHAIIREIDLRRGMWIEAHPEQFPGLKLTEATRRRYPHRDLAAHLVGYRTPISQERLASRRERFGGRDPLDYRAGDRIGKAGIELSYERDVHGVHGRRRLLKNHRGEIVSSEIKRQPLVRPDLILTLDSRLQRHAEELLDAALNGITAGSPEAEEGNELPIPQGGSIVVLDVHSGAVLAAASAPRFDLDLLVQGDELVLENAKRDRRSPFLPRARRMALPPGSVFKTLSAAAFLESGVISAGREFYCQGYLHDPDHHRCYIFRHHGVGHGAVDLRAALSRSCNVYFYTAARRSGPNTIVDWASKLGFGQPTGVDLPGESGGSLPSLRRGSGRNNRWQLADTLGLAIGQSSLTVTPLQMARLMAVVANGGYLVTPHLVSRMGAIHSAVDQPNTESEFSRAAVRIAGLAPDTLLQIHRGLVDVVEDPQGTGHKTVHLPGIPIAGKTGTAEVGGGKPDHAWFAGYAPANQPQVAFVVVLEHAGSGGKAAGPPARKLVRELVRLGLIEGKLEIAAIAE